jgi:adenine phosphoribosyltransferase
MSDIENIHEGLLGKISLVPDFPKQGITFYDLMPLFYDNKAFNDLINSLASIAENRMKNEKFNVSKLVGIEARGFIIGAALAHRLDCGFVPIRKKGKLPGGVIASLPYNLEYGVDTVEIQRNSIIDGEKIFIIDDVLATGNTINTAVGLLNRLGADIKGALFVIELEFLKGRELLYSANGNKDLFIHSLFKF